MKTIKEFNNMVKYDLKGNLYKCNTLFLINEKNEKLVSFGGFERYYLEDMLEKIDEVDKLCVDLSGRNYNNSQVFVEFTEEFKKELKKFDNLILV